VVWLSGRRCARFVRVGFIWKRVMQPVQKVSKSRKGNRRSHHALKPRQYGRCHQCGSPKLAHRACGNCGYHNPTVAVAIASAESE
jgi:large subunit ribosomal protein L32